MFGLEGRVHLPKPRWSLDLSLDVVGLAASAVVDNGIGVGATLYGHGRIPVGPRVMVALAPGVQGAAAGMVSGRDVAFELRTRLGVDLPGRGGAYETGVYLRPGVGVRVEAGQAAAVGEAALELTSSWVKRR